ISAAGEDAVRPRVAVGPKGAVAVWKHYLTGDAAHGSTWEIDAARLPRIGGRWRRPVKIGRETDGSFFPGEIPGPQVAVDAKGAATAVWTGSLRGDIVARSAFQPTGEAWRHPVAISAIGQGTFPAIAISPRGSAAAVWERASDGSQVVMAASRPKPGGRWGAPTRLSAAGADSYQPRIATRSGGSAIVVWTTKDPARQMVPGVYQNGGYTIYATARPSIADDWPAPQAISPSGKNVGLGDVEMNLHGSAIAAWQRPGEDGTIVQAAAYAPGPGTS
ncbi:MAG: hypothetical protein QOJ29_1949, partial [Thermoleophilaceae bacterium]|nr:hypothetical protein [Thermoleophilaceae bacterium]